MKSGVPGQTQYWLSKHHSTALEAMRLSDSQVKVQLQRLFLLCYETDCPMQSTCARKTLRGRLAAKQVSAAKWERKRFKSPFWPASGKGPGVCPLDYIKKVGNKILLSMNHTKHFKPLATGFRISVSCRSSQCPSPAFGHAGTMTSKENGFDIPRAASCLARQGGASVEIYR